MRNRREIAVVLVVVVFVVDVVVVDSRNLPLKFKLCQKYLRQVRKTPKSISIFKYILVFRLKFDIHNL